MVGKQKSSTRALRIHNWQVLSATLGQYYTHIRKLKQLLLLRQRRQLQKTTGRVLMIKTRALHAHHAF